MGQQRAGKLGPRHRRGVHARQRLRRGSCLASRRRRQTSLRPDGRPTPGLRDGGAGKDAQAVDEQRAADRPPRHPHRPAHQRKERRGYCSSHPRRRGFRPEQPTLSCSDVVVLTCLLSDLRHRSNSEALGRARAAKVRMEIEGVPRLGSSSTTSQVRMSAFALRRLGRPATGHLAPDPGGASHRPNRDRSGRERGLRWSPAYRSARPPA